MSALSTGRLKTPARVITLIRSETPFGGAVETREPQGVIWGDFQPRAPVELPLEGGGSLLRQYAEFHCRSAGAALRGALLSLSGQDWTVLSVAEDLNGDVLISLERRL